MADKTKGIREHAKIKSTKRQTEVLEIIRQMKKNGEKISFYSVAKVSGASKSYLYKNKAIAEEIGYCREKQATSRTDASNKVVISSLRMEIRKLKSKIVKLEESNSDSYREKYEKLLEENKELKRQLEHAYSVW